MLISPHMLAFKHGCLGTAVFGTSMLINMLILYLCVSLMGGRVDAWMAGPGSGTC